MRRADLDGLIAFLKVAERRSFTAAARDLGVTPSAISQTVRALEDRAGVALLARTTRDVALTEAGRRFLERARPAVQDILAAFEDAASLGDRPSGLLRLNVPRVALASLIEPVLASFCAAHPAVQVEIHVDDRFANIVEDGFDAGIRLGEFVEGDMVAVRLTPAFRLAVVGSPDYLARCGRPAHPRDLRDHACINFRQGARGGLYHWEFEDAGRDFAVAVDGPVIVNEAGIMMAACVMGLGLAYTLAPVAEPLCEQGLLEPVLEAYCPETPGFFLYFPTRHGVMPKLRAFIDHATARLGRRTGAADQIGA
ncbi:LysR family transcriptional regulator [Salinarimonas soli]|uniref:LysR family transcriptional regulator n=1 Tax=Salinarimonas soli TaxID=1638099 RepID=A0A5B2VD06_9HYPH|nr:LysR family transcriptional regulator [Salinarimonas soli]KAA2236302.1 LysR family transcriptional regulator [Salinarimonas soli]